MKECKHRFIYNKDKDYVFCPKCGSQWIMPTINIPTVFPSDMPNPIGSITTWCGGEL